MSSQAWMRLGWVWAALVMVLALAGRAAAQNEEASASNGPVKGEVVSIGIGGIEGKGGLYRPGSWVPVRVRLENRSGKVVTGRLGVEQPDLDGDKAMSVGAKFILEPSAEARDFWLYYWPRPDDLEGGGGVKQILVLDDTGTGQPLETISAPHGTAAADRIDPKDFVTGRSSRWVVVVGPKAVGFDNFWRAWGGTEAVRLSMLPSANDLPDNVLGLDGVDVIVWEADAVKPSDFAPEFQMKALLDWVQAGGHLIITAGQQAEELKAAGRLHDALPLEVTGTREVNALAVQGLTWTGPGFETKGGKISQLVGKIRENGARAVQGTAGGEFAEHPLAVTGVYGRGAVTLLTVDAASPEMMQGLRGDMAMEFWDQIAGWSANRVKTDAEYGQEKNLPDTEKTQTGVELQVGKGLSSLIDVTEVTQVRLLVAVLFLAVYWLLAGPIGYLILRAYKVVHWSWWVFGGAVVAASALAAGVVMLLHLTSYDLRHKTVMLGAVNSRGVTAIGFYGVFAPASGQLTVEEPYSGGMDYLAPLCEPTDEPVQPFADPQPYVLYDDRAWAPAPVFRNTLKKMEGRWTGERDGLEGHAEVTPAQGAVLYNNATFSGELTNHSGYDLDRVQVIVGGWSATSARARGFVYRVDLGPGVKWGNGQRIDLGMVVKPDTGGQPAGTGAESLDDRLRRLADQYSEGQGMMGRYGGRAFMPPETATVTTADEGNDLLYVLLDAMQPKGLDAPERRDAVRGLARGMDATKLLNAAGGLVIARAGDITKKEYVASPVPLTVNGRQVAGRGDVLFVWALPLKISGGEDLGARGGGARGGGVGGGAGR